MKTRSMNKCFLFCILILFFAACGPINSFEKNVAIPGQEWNAGFKPEVTFDIADTTSLYNIYVVIRHKNAYRYNNIWIKGTVQQPGDTALRSRQYDLRLADDQTGWLGSGMDDIFEHRILIQERTRFTRPGQYRFILEHTMRNDPLEHVMNIGLRIEKAL